MYQHDFSDLKQVRGVILHTAAVIQRSIKLEYFVCLLHYTILYLLIHPLFLYTPSSTDYNQDNYNSYSQYHP